jgi:hypothetical protein
MPALYREKNRYPHLVDEVVDRNVGDAEDEALHAIVWPVVERIAASRRDRAADRVRDRLGTEEASDDLAEVVAAADDGRVELLFVARGAECAGRYDRTTRTVRLRDDGPGAGDLPDRAAGDTFASGGEVWVVDTERMPGANGSVVSALFRYPGPGASLER